MTETPFLSVVIPAYNEEVRLPPTIRRIEDYLEQQEYSWELIVVDDGSKDRTVASAEEAFSRSQSRVEKNPQNVGKGGTVRNGLLMARGEYRLFTDADLSTPIEEVEKLLIAVGNGHDVAIGSRALKDSQVEIHQPFLRELGGKVFNLLVQAVALPGIKDSQCGFKLFSAGATRFIFERQSQDGWGFDVEVLALARRGGYKIAEVPVRWLNSPETKVAMLSDPALMILDVFRVGLRRLWGWRKMNPQP